MNYNKLFAIPTDRRATAARKRSAHFGHSDQFTIVKLENQKATVTATIDNIPHGAGGCLAPISLLRNEQITGIIVGGMGKRPLAMFSESGIEVYWASLMEYPTVDDVISALKSDKLETMSSLQLCSGHDCHHD